MKKGKGDSGKAYHVKRQLSMRKHRRKDIRKKVKDPFIRGLLLGLEDSRKIE